MMKAVVVADAVEVEIAKNGMLERVGVEVAVAVFTGVKVELEVEVEVAVAEAARITAPFRGSPLNSTDPVAFAPVKLAPLAIPAWKFPAAEAERE